VLRKIWLLVLIYSTACTVREPIEPKEDLVLDPQKEYAVNIEMLYSDSAKIKAKINAGLLVKYNDQRDSYEEFLNGVRVEFFDQEEQVSSVLTGKYAIRYGGEDLIYIRDSVVWESKKEEKLETSELIWDDRKQLVYTKKFCVIQRPGELILSQGFEANQDFTEIKLNAIEGEIANSVLKEKEE
jgi:LPS export ABC transporter protein LptC